MTHRESIELLPWYLNSTLDEGQRSAVAAHLGECAECTRELEEIRATQAALMAQEEQAPSEFMLQRALAAIDEYEREKQTTLWSRMFRPAFTRGLVFAQCALILMLGGLLYREIRNRDFTTLSGPGIGQGSGVRIAVGFEPGVTEESMRQTILSVQGKIVNGPSALGLYAVETPVAPEKAEEVVRALQAKRGVVRFAQRIAE